MKAKKMGKRQIIQALEGRAIMTASDNSYLVKDGKYSVYTLSDLPVYHLRIFLENSKRTGI